MIIIKEVDALQESKQEIQHFEEKYGISSECFVNGNYSFVIDPRDERVWKFNIDCFLLCGGELN